MFTKTYAHLNYSSQKVVCSFRIKRDLSQVTPQKNPDHSVHPDAQLVQGIYLVSMHVP